MWLFLFLYFALVIFEIGSHVFAQASLDYDAPIWDSQVIGITDGTTMPSFVSWVWVSLTFYTGWPQPMILLICTSWVAEMTGISHCAQLLFFVIN
jgi:hypothetical protein